MKIKMAEHEKEKESIIRTSLGLMGAAVAVCAVKTCQCIFDKPEELKGSFEK